MSEDGRPGRRSFPPTGRDQRPSLWHDPAASTAGKGKYVSKSDLITDALRELITDRQLSPGTPLRQRDLAEQFDVSYTPVREALRRLESEGLVVTDVHRWATVARTESQEMEENYRILAALEALAGSLAVSKMTNDDVTEIEALYRQAAACQPDADRLAELNRQFHFRIYECARSPMLLLSIPEMPAPSTSCRLPGLSRGHEPGLVGDDDELSAVSRGQLGQQPAHVGLDRGQRYEQLCRDLGIGQPPRH
jgi:DNA-binding GntR family transcriptional regulator